MSKKHLKCPYCNEDIGFVRAFQSKSNEEYFCAICNNFSKVMVSSALKNLAMILAVLVGIVIAVFTFFVKNYILGAALIVLLFLVFYLQVPRFIMLKKKNNK